MSESLLTNRLETVYFETVARKLPGICHELNNPVASVKSNLEALLEYADLVTQFIAELENTASGKADSKAIEMLIAKHDLRLIAEDLPSLAKESRDSVVQLKNDISNLAHHTNETENQVGLMEVGTVLRRILNVFRNEYKYVSEVELQLEEKVEVFCRPRELSILLQSMFFRAVRSVAQNQTISVHVSAQKNITKIVFSGVENKGNFEELELREERQLAKANNWTLGYSDENTYELLIPKA